MSGEGWRRQGLGMERAERMGLPGGWGWKKAGAGAGEGRGWGCRGVGGVYTYRMGSKGTFWNVCKDNGDCKVEEEGGCSCFTHQERI